MVDEATEREAIEKVHHFRELKNLEQKQQAVNIKDLLKRGGIPD